MKLEKRKSPGPVRWISVVYAVLFGASVPWYLPEGPVPLWFGLPYWVVLSLCATTGVAIFTQVVLRRYWPDEDSTGQANAGQERPR